MGLLQCVDCEQEVSDQAVSCPNCGRPISGEQQAPLPVISQATVPAQFIGLIGALALLAGPFLPWVNAMIVEISGFERGSEDAVVIAILGVIALVPPLSSLSSHKNKYALLSILVGIIGGFLSYFHYSSVLEQIESYQGLIQPRVGMGMYVCLGGAAMVVLGGITSLRQ